MDVIVTIVFLGKEFLVPLICRFRGNRMNAKQILVCHAR